MRASEQQPADSLDPVLWARSARHREAQTEHDGAQRRLERLRPRQAEELYAAWQRYREVIEALDPATAELEAVRRCAL
jgi:hypothetical protein